MLTNERDIKAVQKLKQRIEELETTQKNLVNLYFSYCDSEGFDDAMLKLKSLLENEDAV